MGLLNTLPFGNDGFSWEPQSTATNFERGEAFYSEKQHFNSERGTEAAKSMGYLHRRETQLVYIATESIFQISKRDRFWGILPEVVWDVHTPGVLRTILKVRVHVFTAAMSLFLASSWVDFLLSKTREVTFFFWTYPSQSSGYPGRFPVFSPPQQQGFGALGVGRSAEGSAVRIPVPSRIRFENPYPSTKRTSIHLLTVGVFCGLNCMCFCFCFFVWVKLMFGFHLEV